MYRGRIIFALVSIVASSIRFAGAKEMPDPNRASTNLSLFRGYLTTWPPLFSDFIYGFGADDEGWTYYRGAIQPDTFYLQRVIKGGTQQNVEWVPGERTSGASYDNLWSIGKDALFFTPRPPDWKIDPTIHVSTNNASAVVRADLETIQLGLLLGINHAVPGTFRWIDGWHFEAVANPKSESIEGAKIVKGAVARVDEEGVKELSYDAGQKMGRRFIVRYVYDTKREAPFPIGLKRYGIAQGKEWYIGEQRYPLFEQDRMVFESTPGFVPATFLSNHIVSTVIAFTNSVAYSLRPNGTLEPIEPLTDETSPRYSLALRTLAISIFAILTFAGLCWIRAKRLYHT